MIKAIVHFDSARQSDWIGNSDLIHSIEEKIDIDEQKEFMEELIAEQQEQF